MTGVKHRKSSTKPVINLFNGNIACPGQRLRVIILPQPHQRQVLMDKEFMNQSDSTPWLHKYLPLLLLLVLSNISFAESKVKELAPALKDVPHVELMKVAGADLQIRSMGHKDSEVEIILLSGPTDHWHADSAWFALLQPMLAEQYRIHSVDRPGVGLSTTAEPRGYGSLANLMDPLIKNLTRKPVIVVAYASSNLTVWPWLKNSNLKSQVKGIVLIDPDVLLPHSINQYKGDAEPFKKNYEAYKEYMAAGKYNERTRQFIDKEIDEIKTMLKNQDARLMDWQFFHAMMEERLSVKNQLLKLDEVANLGADLDRAKAAGDPTDIPLYVIDTDFESVYINANPDNTSLPKWQAEGTSWFKELAKNSSGHYLELKGINHLVPMAAPQSIVDGIKFLNGEAKP